MTVVHPAPPMVYGQVKPLFASVAEESQTISADALEGVLYASTYTVPTGFVNGPTVDPISHLATLSNPFPPIVFTKAVKAPLESI